MYDASPASRRPAIVLLPDATPGHAFLTGMIEALASDDQRPADAAALIAGLSRAAEAEAAALAELRADLVGWHNLSCAGAMQALAEDRLARADHNDIRARTARFRGFVAGMNVRLGAPATAETA